MAKCSECASYELIDGGRRYRCRFTCVESHPVSSQLICRLFEKKEESKLTYTLEQLIQKWREGERGTSLYKNGAGFKINLNSDGIYDSSTSEYLYLGMATINDTYTRVEQITETDLIGALKMQENGTADRFRLRSKLGAVTQWETDPLLLASGVAWTTLTFECKKEG